MASKVSRAAKAAADEGEWSDRLQALREGAQELDEEVRETVREHPVACLLGAIGAGYLVGRLVARS